MTSLADLQNSLSTLQSRLNAELNRTVDVRAIKEEMASVRGLITTAKREAYETFMARPRPPVLDPTSVRPQPSAEVMLKMTKTEWFATLSDKTKFELASFGLASTRAALQYECDRMIDEGFYDSISDDFQCDIDLAANVADDGKDWIT